MKYEKYYKWNSVKAVAIFCILIILHAIILLISLIICLANIGLL